MRIPAQSLEIERVFAHIMSGAHHSVALCSADSGEGVTSIALALTQRILLSGYSALIVDMNSYHPSLQSVLPFNLATVAEMNTSKSASRSLLQEQARELCLTPNLVSSSSHALSLTGVTIPTQRAAIIRLRKPGVLEALVEQWQQEYDFVIFDTSPVNRVNASNVPAERVAAACDTCILVVQAGVTTEAVAQRAIQTLENAGAKISGCVYNDRVNPPLKSEVIREVKRLPKFLAGLTRWLMQKINDNRLLSLEI